MILQEAIDSVSSCGKFQGELVYVPLLWELALDGSWETTSDSHASFGYICIFEDLAVDHIKEQFPDWKDIEFPTSVAVWEHDNGFVTELPVEDAFSIIKSWYNEGGLFFILCVQASVNKEYQKEITLTVSEFLDYAVERYPDVAWEEMSIDDATDLLGEKESNPAKEWVTYYVEYYV